MKPIIDTNPINYETMRAQVLPEGLGKTSATAVVGGAMLFASAPGTAGATEMLLQNNESIIENYDPWGDTPVDVLPGATTQPAVSDDYIAIDTPSPRSVNSLLENSDNIATPRLQDARIAEPVQIMHPIGEGDTLTSILKSYNITRDAILTTIEDDDVIYAGESIELRVESPYQVSVNDINRETVIDQLTQIHNITPEVVGSINNTQDTIVVPVNMHEHTIVEGETLGALAPTTLETVASINGIENVNLIHAEDTILLPAEPTTSATTEPEYDESPFISRNLELREETSLYDIASALVQIDAYAEDFADDISGLAEELQIENEIEDVTRIPVGTSISIGRLSEEEYAGILDTYSEIANQRIEQDIEPVIPPTIEAIEPSLEVSPALVDDQIDESIDENRGPALLTPDEDMTAPDVDTHIDTAELYTTYQLEDFSAEYQELVSNIPDIQEAVELYDFWRTGNFGPQITAEDVVKKNINAGWSGDDLVIVVALELGAESNRAPFVINTWAEHDDRFELGTVAVGGLQVLGNIYGEYKGESQSWLVDPMRDPQSNLDPMFNAYAAYEIYRESNESFTPWQAYTEGTHLQYMDEAAYHIDQVINEQAVEPSVDNTDVGDLDNNIELSLEHSLIDLTTIREEDGMIIDGVLQRITVVNVDGMPVNTEIALNVANLVEAARDAGHDLTIGSAHRPMWRQEELRITNGCPDINESPASTCRVPTARPGFSRHQSGLALDLGIRGSALCFPNNISWCQQNGTNEEQAALQWLHENGEEYGLIPLVSGSEAWHFSTDGR